MYSESPFNNTKQSDKTQTLKNFFEQNECVFVGRRRGVGGGATEKFYIFDSVLLLLSFIFLFNKKVRTR